MIRSSPNCERIDACGHKKLDGQVIGIPEYTANGALKRCDYDHSKKFINDVLRFAHSNLPILIKDGASRIQKFSKGKAVQLATDSKLLAILAVVAVKNATVMALIARFAAETVRKVVSE